MPLNWLGKIILNTKITLLNYTDFLENFSRNRTGIGIGTGIGIEIGIGIEQFPIPGIFLRFLPIPKKTIEKIYKKIGIG